MQQYDLVVIGSGPGGQRASIQAAKSGKRVAVVEKHATVGGVCINTGTIPSKTMREAVLHLSGFYDQAFYGANYHAKESVTMSDLSFRVESTTGYSELQGEFIVLATGTKPAEHPNVPINGRNIINSDQILTMPT